MSINSFAAVVGDNDGAAFITKAEFESLKNDFQTQINRYNSSLDNKIDGAIASYLAGVTVAKVSQLVNLTTTAKNDSAYNIGFVSWEAPNVSRDAVDVAAGLYWFRQHGSSADRVSERDDGAILGNFGLNNGPAWGGGIVDQRYHDYDKTTSNYDSYLYLIEWPFAEQNADTRKSEGNLTGFTLKYTNRYRCYMRLRSSFLQWSWTLPNNNTATNYGLDSEIFTNFTAGAAAISEGPGFSDDPNGHNFGSDQVRPTLYISHTWSAWPDNGSNDMERKRSKLNYLWANVISGTDKMVDFAFRDSYVPDNPFDVPIAYTKPQATPPGVGSYSGSYNNQYYYIQASDELKIWGGDSLGANYNQSMTFRWKWNRQKVYTNNWSICTQKFYNELLKVPFYKYEGIPICRTPNTVGKLKFKLKFTNKVLTTGANVNPTSSANYYTYVITDKKFKNANLPTKGSTDTYWKDTDGYDHVFVRAVRNSGSYSYTTDWIEIDKSKIIDKDNGDYIYVKVTPNNADQVVSVEVTDLITYTEGG